MAIGGFLRAVLFAVIGLTAIGWAASPDGEEQAQDRQCGEGGTEVAESESAQQNDSAGGRELERRIKELLRPCKERCFAASDSLPVRNSTGLSFFACPSCIVSNLLDANNFQGSDAPVGIAIFVIVFAVLMRQAIMGHREGWRLSFALFLIGFFAAVTGYSEISETIQDAGADLPIFGFVMVVFASALFAGVLSFWTKYLLDLLAVVLLAVLLVGLIYLGDINNSLLRDSLGVVTGVAGGVWLHWWRDVRKDGKRRQSEDDGKAPEQLSGRASLNDQDQIAEGAKHAD